MGYGEAQGIIARDDGGPPQAPLWMDTPDSIMARFQGSVKPGLPKKPEELALRAANFNGGTAPQTTGTERNLTSIPGAERPLHITIGSLMNAGATTKVQKKLIEELEQSIDPKNPNPAQQEYVTGIAKQVYTQLMESHNTAAARDLLTAFRDLGIELQSADAPVWQLSLNVAGQSDNDAMRGPGFAPLALG